MYTIKTPTTRDDFKAYYALRYKVLREPLGYPKGTEKDDYEPISEHFMAVNEKGEVVGVVKLYREKRGRGTYLSPGGCAGTPAQGHRSPAAGDGGAARPRARLQDHWDDGTCDRHVPTSSRLASES